MSNLGCGAAEMSGLHRGTWALAVRGRAHGAEPPPKIGEDYSCSQAVCPKEGYAAKLKRNGLPEPEVLPEVARHKDALEVRFRSSIGRSMLSCRG